MRFGSTAKVLAECKLKYYRISECAVQAGGAIFFEGSTGNSNLYVANSQLTGNQVAFDPAGKVKTGLGGG